MAQVIECDPHSLMERAGGWLECEPVLHNVICTVLQRAIVNPAPFGNAQWFAVEDCGEPAEAVDRLVALADGRRIAVLCLENDQRRCHRQVVLEAAVSRQPALDVLPLH